MAGTRMHLTLKQQATKPAAPNLLQQQARFDAFLRHYNDERPHQALAMKSPQTSIHVDPPLSRPRRARLFSLLRGADHREFSESQRPTARARSTKTPPAMPAISPAVFGPLSALC